jgi:hypothetical protein
MAYRDDLEAALAHAEAAERELADAKSALDKDEKRIAELEEQLAAARRRTSSMKSAKPPDNAKSGVYGTVTTGLFIAVIVGFGIGFAFLKQSCRQSQRQATLPKPNPVAGQPAPQNTLDVSGAVGAASKMTIAEFSDGVIYRIEADYVDEAGLANLSYGGDVTYRFVSPSRAAQPPPSAAKLGAPVVDNRQSCRIYVRASLSRGMRLGSSYNSGCEEIPTGPVQCTVAQIWAKAREAGAPSGALASVNMRTRNGKRKWNLSITDNATHQAVFSRDFPDDCGAR